MKRLFRAVIFYALAIYGAGLVIPGFNVAADVRTLVISGLILAILFTFVRPVFNFLLLPINLFTLGLFSFFSQVLTFYVFLWLFPDYVHISAWRFPGWDFVPLALHIGAFEVNSFFTIVLATLIISFIVSGLSFLL